jgi:hypothetical protein
MTESDLTLSMEWTYGDFVDRGGKGLKNLAHEFD